MADRGRRTEGWQTGGGGGETRRQEDGRRGAEDKWVVDGMEKGGGGRVILLNCFGTIAVSILLASMLFHWGDGQKRTMYVCRYQHFCGAQLPLPVHSPATILITTLFSYACVLHDVDTFSLLNYDLSGGVLNPSPP